MLVEAIYDNGRLIFPQQFHFAHERFSIKVEVPDAEIVATKPEQAVQSGASMAVSSEYPAGLIELQKLRNACFGKGYVYVQEKTDREIMQEHWVKKYA